MHELLPQSIACVEKNSTQAQTNHHPFPAQLYE